MAIGFPFYILYIAIILILLAILTASVFLGIKFKAMTGEAILPRKIQGNDFDDGSENRPRLS